MEQTNKTDKKSELEFNISKSSQVYFIATFKMRKRKQRKTIQSRSQLYLYSITLNNNNKRNFR